MAQNLVCLEEGIAGCCCPFGGEINREDGLLLVLALCFSWLSFFCYCCRIYYMTANLESLSN